MFASRLVLYLAAGLIALPLAAQRASKPTLPGEPKLLSMHPFTGRPGQTFETTLRGNSILTASAVYADGAPMKLSILGAKPEPPPEGMPKPKVAAELVTLRVEVNPDAAPGRYPIRLVSPGGVSNWLPVFVTKYPVAPEPDGLHETADQAVPVTAIPAVYTGRIAKRGEADFYSFKATAGQVITFEVLSGLPSTGAPGGNANGFDPSIAIYEPTGSWFDPKHLNRLAFNDEPLWVIGKATEAYLVYEFKRTGQYLVKIEAFSGQGGPDYSYQLKMLPGKVPQDVAPEIKDWEERTFTRNLSQDRLNELATRGGKPPKQKSVETYRAASGPADQAPVVKLPANVEGAIAEPNQTQRAKFVAEGPLDLAIEMETPELGPPLFNPVVRLVNEKGEEVATNIFTGRGACTGALTKAITSKTILPIRNAGQYMVEIRDTTADMADPGFRYRLQLRPQVPHLGQVKIDADHLNLKPGAAQTVRVTFDREEDYRGAVAVSVDRLPAGVQALAGADFEPDKDPPTYPGKRERYVPRTERSVVVFTADDNAPVTEKPQVARVVVRPVVDGKPGAVLATKDVLVMVTPGLSASVAPIEKLEVKQ